MGVTGHQHWDMTWNGIPRRRDWIESRATTCIFPRRLVISICVMDHTGPPVVLLKIWSFGMKPASAALRTLRAHEILATIHQPCTSFPYRFPHCYSFTSFAAVLLTKLQHLDKPKCKIQVQLASNREHFLLMKPMYHHSISLVNANLLAL